jgi:hypothetical protein
MHGLGTLVGIRSGPASLPLANGRGAANARADTRFHFRTGITSVVRAPPHVRKRLPVRAVRLPSSWLLLAQLTRHDARRRLKGLPTQDAAVLEPGGCVNGDERAVGGAARCRFVPDVKGRSRPCDRLLLEARSASSKASRLRPSDRQRRFFVVAVDAPNPERRVVSGLRSSPPRLGIGKVDFAPARVYSALVSPLCRAP